MDPQAAFLLLPDIRPHRPADMPGIQVIRKHAVLCGFAAAREVYGSACANLFGSLPQMPSQARSRVWSKLFCADKLQEWEAPFVLWNWKCHLSLEVSCHGMWTWSLSFLEQLFLKWKIPLPSRPFQTAESIVLYLFHLFPSLTPIMPCQTTVIVRCSCLVKFFRRNCILRYNIYECYNLQD